MTSFTINKLNPAGDPIIEQGTFYQSYSQSDTQFTLLPDGVTDLRTKFKISVLPVADFSADVVSGDEPLTVQFTDSSTGGIISWLWNFGDSNTSTLQNPSHQYGSAGTYTVTLTVSNYGGEDSEIKTEYITVLSDVCWWNDDFSGSAIDTNKWIDEYNNFAGDGTLSFGDPTGQLTSLADITGDFQLYFDMYIDFMDSGGFNWDFYAALTIGGTTINCGNYWDGTEYYRYVSGAGSDTEEPQYSPYNYFSINIERNGTDLTVNIDDVEFTRTVGTDDATISFIYDGYDENDVQFGPFEFISGCPEEPI